MDTPTSATLTPPFSPQLKPKADICQNPSFSASNIIEYLATRPENTSILYLYDLAEQAGFGILTREWSNSSEITVPVISTQTRAGAGLSIVGRLSAGTSHDGSAHLTAYTTPTGLSAMAPSLAHLPPATPSSRLIIQVPSISPIGDSFSLAPSLAPLSTVLPFLPKDVTVLLSATPQQSVDFTAISYHHNDSHIVHIFDQYSSAREIGVRVIPPSGKILKGKSLLENLRASGHDFFTYAGDSSPRTVFVLLNSPLAQVAQALARDVPGLGVISVNVIRPWEETAFQNILPSSATSVYVVDEVPNLSTQGVLFSEVFGTLVPSGGPRAVRPLRISSAEMLEYTRDTPKFISFLEKYIPAGPSFHSSLPKNSKRILLLADPASPLSLVSGLIQTMFTESTLSSRLLVSHDAFSKPGGVSISHLLLSPPSHNTDWIPLPSVVPIHPGSNEEIDFLAVLDQSLLKSHSILECAVKGAPILVVTTWTPEDLVLNLPPSVIELILDRNLRLYTLDIDDVVASIHGASSYSGDALRMLLVHFAFLRLYLGNKATEELVVGLSQSVFPASLDSVLMTKINSYVWDALKVVENYAPRNDIPVSDSLRYLDFNAIAVDVNPGETVVNGARLGSWHDAAKHLLFPAIYSQDTLAVEGSDLSNPALRPEIPDRTYLVTCTVNRRLTPTEYDRNVFHLEFDSQGTGLKYEIGEALGIHGWNDEMEVVQFCEWYGVNPNRVITIAVPDSERESGKNHTRTIFQALQQQVDLFGRPPKSFYSDLAAYASNTVDRYSLQFIGSSEGSSTFKKLSEKDTVTFADVLRMYPSAHPPIEVLAALIGDIKPRHYSIASAQSVVGDRIDLLVVMVDWISPEGEVRYGQCTRYLAGLIPGQKVTVSIKPSVMKLPPNDMQPLILAGLGTGVAPFRAFLQHRAHLAAQKKPIGPIYYYFGSRHQSQEYLYGEEIESFILDGIITHAGLAFSRDGSKKVYIQNKMQEDAHELVNMLQDQEGVFYLCGPTWPVPDVYEALVGALVEHKGMDREIAGEYLESLKEEERYVLEVY